MQEGYLKRKFLFVKIRKGQAKERKKSEKPHRVKTRWPVPLRSATTSTIKMVKLSYLRNRPWKNIGVFPMR
jgi:hypothetical protein